MRMVFKIDIDRPASTVWKYVNDPESFQEWNDKIESMDVRGEFRVGEPFKTSYKWRDTVTQCLSVVTQLSDERLLELRHSDFIGVDVDPHMVAIERIVLNEGKGRTRVTKILSVKNHGVPLIFVPLLWFVSRFGKPKDPDPLKLMCEAGH